MLRSDRAEGRQRRPRLWCIAGVLTAAASAGAQCPPGFAHWFTEDGFDGRIVTATPLDEDGPGPLPPSLLVSGGFTTHDGRPISRLARWDGAKWTPFTPAPDGQANFLGMLDLDGDGPEPPQLIAAGTIRHPSGTAAVVRWTGTAWAPIGGPFDNWIHDAAVFDPDGAGPEPASLVVAGLFTNAGGVPANRIARWDGIAWQPLGTGFESQAYRLAVFDEDGDGPDPARLFVGGPFSTAGGAPIAGLARWDGSVWSQVGAGFDENNPSVESLHVFDADGAGPGVPALYAAGRLFDAGSAVTGVARWDGQAWTALADSTVAGSLGTFDPDGDGPAAAQLFSSGLHIHRLDGDTWTRIASANSSVLRSATHDPDGRGPAAPQLVFCGQFTQIDGVTAPHIATWDGMTFSSVGPAASRGLNLQAYAMATSDDAASPSGRAVFVGGQFTRAGDVPAAYIAKWDGQRWSPLGQGLRSEARCIVPFVNADGRPALLVGGFSQTLPDGTPINGLAVWDGAAWSSLGGGPGGGVFAAAAGHTADGFRVFVARRNGVNRHHIRQWDGTAWTTLPGELEMNEFTADIVVYDADADGPLSGELHVPTSRFGGTWIDGLARWDGTAWSATDDELEGDIDALAIFDRDGPGPLPPVLIAGGSFNHDHDHAIRDIAMWDGTSWSALGEDLHGPVTALGAFDPDGPGPQPDVLVVAGINRTDPRPHVPPDTALDGLAYWDGAEWTPIAGDFGSREAVAIAALDEDGPGPGTPGLYFAGDFRRVEGVSSAYIARWGEGPDIGFRLQPADATVRAGAAAQFTVVASSNGALTYQWRRNGAPLADDGRITGATTPTLLIADTRPEDEGGYDCVVSNLCGFAATRTAQLRVTCPADFNGDGKPTVQDFSDFRAAYLAGDLSADYSGDGELGVNDFSAFRSAYLAGCP